MDPAFFARPARLVAPELIGCDLVVAGCGGMIVETEAYDLTDPASHSFNGPTPRNRSMFGPSGHAYVYRSYGIHWCLNFVCEPGSAVLLRALAPRAGLDSMRARRKTEALHLLCAGPGRLCQALDVDVRHDGLPLDQAPFALRPSAGAAQLVCAPRIGISQAIERPWRFPPSPGRRSSAVRRRAGTVRRHDGTSRLWRRSLPSPHRPAIGSARPCQPFRLSSSSIASRSRRSASERSKFRMPTPPRPSRRRLPPAIARSIRPPFMKTSVASVRAYDAPTLREKICS